MSNLVLLGGPPGVGKSTVVEDLRRRQIACVEADEVVSPGANLGREQAIGKVLDVADRALLESHNLLVSWVFARPELYTPFLDRFARARVSQLYLVCNAAELRARLAMRGDGELLDYALDRMRLIDQLPYEKIDTSAMTPSDIANEICKAYFGARWQA